jgi:Flp pilus assembly protein TadD
MHLPGRFHYAVGRVLGFWGWTTGAVQAFRDALRQAPSPEAQFHLGEALMRLQRWGEAAEVFAVAASLRPSDAEVQGNLVLALGRSGHWKQAEQELRRLIDLRPRQAELHVLHGAVLRIVHRPEEAIRSFRWALRLPAAAVQFRLGEALLGEVGWQGVMASFETARRAEAPAAEKPAADWRSPLHDHPCAGEKERRPRPPSAPVTRGPTLARLLGSWLRPAPPFSHRRPPRASAPRDQPSNRVPAPSRP